MLKHKTEVRIRYADTDQMKYVYNGKYFEYFEVGRTEMMRDHNLTYKNIEERGYYMPVIETYIKFISPAYYDEQLIIESRVENLPTVKVRIDHTIICKDRNVIIAEGYVVLAFLDANTGKPIRAPKFFIDAVKGFYD